MTGCLSAIMALFIVLAGCAEAPPAFDDLSSMHRIDQIDSTDSVELERIFIDSHSRILGEITRLERSTQHDVNLIEIKSIVIIAEEVYLQGNVMLALNLLTEAELLLRQTP